MDAPSEVCNLELVVVAKQQIFRLNIAVDHVAPVQVHQCGDHAFDIAGSSLLVEADRLLEFLEQCSAGSVFEDQIDSLLVVEESVHSVELRETIIWLKVDESLRGFGLTSKYSDGEDVTGFRFRGAPGARYPALQSAS